MYPDPKAPWRSRIDDHHAPDLERWPLFSEATPIRVTLGPGETLFIPCGWWHTARSLTVTISVAFDQLETGNWADFRQDLFAQRAPRSRFKAHLVDTWLALAGQVLTLGERALRRSHSRLAATG
jgi:hypothetical protein